MEKNMISLKSSDGDIFEVEEVVARQSKMIQLMIEDGCAGSAIPLQNVTSEILVKIIEYCKRHAANKQISCPSISYLNKASSSASASTSAASTSASAASTSASTTSTDDLKNFDKEFVKVDWETLIDIILATNYLEIKDLLDLTCQAAADYIKDKTPEEVRTLFNVENDFTPEEEAAIRKEYAWAFE